MKKIINTILLIIMLLLTVCFTGCDNLNSYTMTSDEANSDVKLTFEAALYDNEGNNYVTFRGKSFDIKPNKVKTWGYNTNGTWTSWYETSSVVSIIIDGHSVETCGSTVLFKDSRIDIKPLDINIGILDSYEKSGYTENIKDSVLKNYLALTNWWFDMHEDGQGGEKIVLIQSQDGYNIGVVEGKDIYWDVAEKLPKTTLLQIDGKPFYIHRCNFTIIDTALFDKVVMPTEQYDKSEEMK